MNLVELVGHLVSQSHVWRHGLRDALGTKYKNFGGASCFPGEIHVHQATSQAEIQRIIIYEINVTDAKENVSVTPMAVPEAGARRTTPPPPVKVESQRLT